MDLRYGYGVLHIDRRKVLTFPACVHAALQFIFLCGLAMALIVGASGVLILVVVPFFRFTSHSIVHARQTNTE